MKWSQDLINSRYRGRLETLNIMWLYTSGKEVNSINTSPIISSLQYTFLYLNATFLSAVKL